MNLSPSSGYSAVESQKTDSTIARRDFVLCAKRIRRMSAHYWLAAGTAPLLRAVQETTLDSVA